MSVGIAKINTVRVIFSTMDFDAGVFERCFDFFIIASR